MTFIEDSATLVYSEIFKKLPFKILKYDRVALKKEKQVVFDFAIKKIILINRAKSDVLAEIVDCEKLRRISDMRNATIIGSYFKFIIKSNWIKGPSINLRFVYLSNIYEYKIPLRLSMCNFSVFNFMHFRFNENNLEFSYIKDLEYLANVFSALYCNFKGPYTLLD